jgi:hypothetical protein
VPELRNGLAEIALAEGLVDAQRLSAAQRYARRSGEPLVVALVELERVGEVAIVAALARHLSLPIVELAAEHVEPEVLREVPHELARRRRLLPLHVDHGDEGPGAIRVAMADPTDRDAITELEISTGCRVDPVLTTLGAVDEAIARAYRGIVTAIMQRDGRPVEPAEAPRVPFGGDLLVATPALPYDARRPVPSTGPTTVPMHNLEDEASLAVRHRALLEVLVTKGVLTPEEYWEEVRRLLKESS